MHSPHGLLPHTLYLSVLCSEPVHSAIALEAHAERKPIHIVYFNT